MIELIPVHGVPIIAPGTDLPSLISEVVRGQLHIGDIVVVTHSIVSVSEGKLFRKEPIDGEKDVRTDIAIKEAIEVIRESPILITRTKQGLITDFSGIDESNAPPGMLVGLPDNPDLSAEKIHRAITESVGFNVPVIITDTEGRPWRKGAVNLAIGLAGMSPFIINKGKEDLFERELKGSLVCLADQIAAASELVMGQADEEVPVVIVRGIEYDDGVGSASEIIREESENLF
jgi:coenzyme F420-0:L-glutamate ligase/coenzyme F420-1:gamma-L-glutamate ligase